MPDISTSNQQKLNGVMCPICQEFSVGSRIAYFTTGGALSSATITAPTITSGTMADMTLTGVGISTAMIGTGTIYAPAAGTGTTDGAGLTAMTSGSYLLDPNDASGMTFHLTSAGTTGTMVSLINIATGATAVICLGATEDTAGGAFIASSSGYFNFTIRANSIVNAFCFSATRWLLMGATAGISGLAAATA